MSASCYDKIVPANRESVIKAAEILREGGLVAFPTETVYGLGANALDAEAVKRIYDAKERPQTNPLILHVGGIRDAAAYAEVTSTAELLMHAFWPGPLTVVLYSLALVPGITRGFLDTVALRVPHNSTALDLIRRTGLPIAAPSANKSGRPSPTSAQAVADDLGRDVDLILDGGPTMIGLESTVVDATEDMVAILRPGGVTKEMLQRVVDLFDGDDEELSYRSPGTSHRHYAPAIPIVLWNGGDRRIFDKVSGMEWCYIGMKEPPAGAKRTAVFASVDDYARGLFAMLREMEHCGKVIVAELPDDRGLGTALRNRLLRAAGA